MIRADLIALIFAVALEVGVDGNLAVSVALGEEKQGNPCCAECKKNEECVLKTRCKGICDDTPCPYINGCTDYEKGEFV